MSDDETQFVTLCLGTEVFAAPVSQVREILDYRESFRIPEGPPWLMGLIDVRGAGVPVIDLRTKLGLRRAEPTAQTRIMVLDVPLKDRVLSLGLVADRVLEVASFAGGEIAAAPDVGVPWRSDYIAGVVRRDEGFVVIFDMPRLLTSNEIESLTESVREAA
jgi:purine-binding chemotaxis protein CheW